MSFLSRWIVSICCLLPMFILGGHQLLADDIQGFPRDAYKASSGPLKTIKDLVKPIADYRVLLFDEKLIKDRMARAVCIIDSTNRSHGKVQEAKVTSGTPLEVVMEASGVPNWNGQGGIFLFQRNAIARSPDQLDKAALERFYQTPIYPGDLIYIGFTF